MKRLVCEFCNNTDFKKENGEFVCLSCGRRYPSDEAQKHVAETGSVPEKPFTETVPDPEVPFAETDVSPAPDADPEQTGEEVVFPDAAREFEEAISENSDDNDKNILYLQAVDLINSGDEERIVIGAELMKSISGWSNAEEWYETAGERLASLRRLQIDEKKEKRKKQR